MTGFHEADAEKQQTEKERSGDAGVCRGAGHFSGFGGNERLVAVRL